MRRNKNPMCKICGQRKPGKATWLEYGKKYQVCKACLKEIGERQLVS